MRSDPGAHVNPLVIGVTGHRDLLPSETDELYARTRALFDELSRRFPNTPLRVMSALAEGADRLAAHVALECGWDLQVVLPMPADDYRQDFLTTESVAEFDALCAQAEVLSLEAGSPDNEALITLGSARDAQYARAGMFISAHCHILLALWDGQPSDRLGGTAQIIYFQHYDRLPGIAESVPRSSLFLTDDESDLVYHIACSRKQTNSTPARPLTPMDTRWLTTDPDFPSLESMPERYVRVFARMDEFNVDARDHLSNGYSLTELDPEGFAVIGHPSIQRIGDMFGATDVLADHYQRRVNQTLRAIYTLAVLTGLAFILYSDLVGLHPLIYAFLAFLLINISLAMVAQRRQWHRKYLDYRVLAEGLRVQFYWAVAGVRGEGQTKFAYDNFLRQRDMELGWIRNVMRVAGTPNDAHPASLQEAGLQFAIDHWIGTADEPGQLDYYRVRAKQRSRANRLTDGLALLCLWSGICVAIILAVFTDTLAHGFRDTLVVLMGVLPLIAGVAEAYTRRKADRELTKQFVFMAHVFANARRRLDEATTNADRRDVLKGLGDAALTEHAEWILIHRERHPEPAGF